MQELRCQHWHNAACNFAVATIYQKLAWRVIDLNVANGVFYMFLFVISQNNTYYTNIKFYFKNLIQIDTII